MPNFLIYKNYNIVNIAEIASVTWPHVSSSVKSPRNIMFKLRNNQVITWIVPYDDYENVAKFIRVRLSGTDETLKKVQQEIMSPNTVDGLMTKIEELIDQRTTPTKRVKAKKQ